MQRTQVRMSERADPRGWHVGGRGLTPGGTCHDHLWVAQLVIPGQSRKEEGNAVALFCGHSADARLEHSQCSVVAVEVKRVQHAHRCRLLSCDSGVQAPLSCRREAEGTQTLDGSVVVQLEDAHQPLRLGQGGGRGVLGPQHLALVRPALDE